MKRVLASLALAGMTAFGFAGVALAAPSPIPAECTGQTTSQTFTAGRESINVTADNRVVFVNSNSNSVKVSGLNDCVVVAGNSNSVKVTGNADVVVINGSSNSVNATNALGNDVVVDNGSRNSTTTNGTFTGNGTQGTINGHAYTPQPPVEPLAVALKVAAKHVR